MWRAVAAVLPRAKVPVGRTCRLPPPQTGRSLLRGTPRHRWPGAAPGVRPPQTLGMNPGIQRVEALDAGRLVRVEWEDGSESRYPCVWLRDNCQCPRCFLRSARARRLQFEDLDVDIVAKDIALPDRKKVSITWPDDHASEYEAEWLKKRCFSEEARAEMRKDLFLPERQYWGSDLQLPKIPFEEIICNDECAYKWLCTLKKVGIVLLTGATTRQGELVKLGHRIGFLRLTFYGYGKKVSLKVPAFRFSERFPRGTETAIVIDQQLLAVYKLLLAMSVWYMLQLPEKDMGPKPLMNETRIVKKAQDQMIQVWLQFVVQRFCKDEDRRDRQTRFLPSETELRPTWQVQDKADANNVAYTTGKLCFHTDYPVLQHPPGVQFLHCIKQTGAGGESEVVDGFHVANKLKKQNPQAYQILSSTAVDYTDVGVDYCDFAVQCKQRIIDVDSRGEVVRINYNNATRDTVFDIPAEKVRPFYAALKEFNDLLNSAEHKFTFKLKPGDVVTFDNWRVLHGRQSYQSGSEVTRHLEGAYADWDVVMSRLRLLRKSVLNKD